MYRFQQLFCGDDVLLSLCQEVGDQSNIYLTLVWSNNNVAIPLLSCYSWCLVLCSFLLPSSVAAVDPSILVNM